MLMIIAPGGLSAFQLNDNTILDGYAEAYGVGKLSHTTPNHNITATGQIDLTQNYGSTFKFKAIMQAVWDGKVRDAYNKGVILSYDEVFQNKRRYIRPEEVYLDVYTEFLDIRVGIQKFAWGRMYELNPTDNLNPEDLTEFYIPQENDRKIGVPAVKLNYYNEDFANIEVAFIPRYVPYRLPDPDERWFFPLAKPPEDIDSVLGKIPIEVRYHDIDMSDDGLENSEVAIKFSKYINGVDVSVSYFWGYDIRPTFRGEAMLTGSTERPEINADIYPTMHRIHVAGGDLITTVGDFTIRGEAAYYWDRYHMRDIKSLLSEYGKISKQWEIVEEAFTAGGGLRYYDEPELEVQKDSFECGVGVDYMLKGGDLVCMAQVIYDHIFDYDIDLVFNNWDMFFMGAVQAYFHNQALILELPVIYTIPQSAYMYKPSAAYLVTDFLKITVGAVLIDGNHNNFLGQFNKNDQIFAKVRLSF